ncbi:hypothetical protein [Oceanobacillus sp. CAU 1775]
MNKIFVNILLVLFLIVLSACTNNSSNNTISLAELTDREDSILSTTTDKAFIFDFETDGEYEIVSVWIEKYESGELIDELLNELTSQIDENGSIIITIPKTMNTGKQHTFNIGVGSNGTTGSLSNYDTNSIELSNMASVWGNFPGELSIDDDELLLAHICYTQDEYGRMSSLSTDFYDDPEANIDKLEEYDVVYLFKAVFVK